MVSVVYPVIHFIIKIIFAKEYGVKRLKARARLLNHLHKIRVILVVQVKGDKVIRYFCI